MAPFWLAIALCATPAILPAPAEAAQRPHVKVPEQDVGIDTLEGRRRAQAQQLAGSGVYHAFRFRDRLPESGITFRHRIVDDAGYHYKPVHYDHGNGIAAADVDGDGRIDLYFTTQLGRNELWRNLGGARFEDFTEKAGVGLADRVSVTAAFADIDNDGDPDLYVTTVRMGNALFENDGTGRFRDISESAGVDYSGHSSGAVFFDYDGDGLLDLFLANVGVYTTDEQGTGDYWVGNADAFLAHVDPARAERSILYRNRGGNRFADVSEQVGLVDSSWSGDAAFANLSGDAFPDLYVLNMQGDDHYYENVAGERFVERTGELFPKTPWGAMGVEVFDLDNDGRLDVYITDMHSDMAEDQLPGKERLKSEVEDPERHYSGVENNILGNALYRSTRDGRFEEISDRAGAENYWPWGVSAGDLNADGWDDTFVAASMNFPYRYGVNALQLNDHGRFLRAEMVLGVEPRRDGRTHTEWFDLDCSGRDAARPLCSEHEGEITVMAPLGSRASVLFDLDDDGDLDVVTNEFNSEPQVLVSNLSETKPVHFLEVRLIGTRSNRDALGALVRVQAGDRTLTQPSDGKSGYLSQSSLPLYFGLGDAETVERVEVVWPDGREQVVAAPITIVDGLLEIREPESATSEP